MASKQQAPAQDGAVEATTFHLVEGKSLDDFIAANREIGPWLRTQPGFRSRHMFQDGAGLVYDLIFWDSEAQGTAAMHKLMDTFADADIHTLIDHSTVNWFVKPVFP